MMNVLVTGGAGYIGSHVVEELQKNGFTPIVYDNLSTGHAAAVPEEVQLVEGDIHDVAFLKHIMAQFEIDAVIHFAASSLVGESMENPSKYYFNNVEGSLHLLEAMKGAGVDYIVFSSTAAVYGEPESVPIKEDSRLNPTNVYGRTKLMIEKMLADYDMAYEMRYVALRYFNAAGASPSRDIGEDHDPESHLIPPFFNFVDYRQDNPVRDLTQSQDSQLTTKDGPVVKDGEYVEISHSQSYKTRFLYDNTNNVYLMQQNFSGNWRDTIDEEYNDYQLQFPNVIVLFTDIHTYPGHETTDLQYVEYSWGGIGYYFYGGKCEKIYWQKGTPLEALRLYYLDENGQCSDTPCEINIGKSYVTIVDVDEAINLKVGNLAWMPQR